MDAVPSALLFDLDGTLIDSYEAIHESLSHAMRAAGLDPLPMARVRRMVGRGLEVLVAEAMGEERAALGVKLFRERYDEVCLQRTRLLPDVADTLARLHEARLPMAICSNKLARFTRRIVDHLRVGHCFRAIVGPEDVARPKPDPEMLAKALATLGAHAEDALYVGDMPLDVMVARAACVPVAVIASGSSDETELRSAGADYVLTRFTDLLRLCEVP